MRNFGWIVLVLVLVGAGLIVAFGVALIGPAGGIDLTDVGEHLIGIGLAVGIVAIALMVALARHGPPG